MWLGVSLACNEEFKYFSKYKSEEVIRHVRLELGIIE